MSDSFEYDVPPNQQILLQKQTEWAGLHALKEASDQLVERIEKLSQMSNVMADGGEGESHACSTVAMMTSSTIRTDDGRSTSDMS